MAILVIGGSGYVGSHVVNKLVDQGHEVVVVDNATTSHPQYIKNVDYLCFSYGDSNLMDKLLSDYDIDSVIHLGGLINVRESMEKPELYYHVNVEEGENLIRILKKHNIDKFIFSSSCAVYGNPKYVPINEEHPLDPVSTYGNTKMLFEKLLKEYDMDYINLRYFNVSGSNGILGENHKEETHVIPLLIQSILQGKEFNVFGDGKQKRDFIHVEDLAEAHVQAYHFLKRGHGKETFNIGSGEGVTLKELIDLSGVLFKREIPVQYHKKREADPHILIADTKKAQEILGFKASYQLHDILLSHWNWINQEKVMK
ncbi:UDP-glucose 4-epimerase GalE [Virgibacillus sp. CBA3643]|uniref:UDP-glucose 4-epimerase GalE n=1 Tax=Virgibacillus sp. CBA3643 TaxID=2942278 RepID=UPI0035A2B880